MFVGTRMQPSLAVGSQINCLLQFFFPISAWFCMASINKKIPTISEQLLIV